MALLTKDRINQFGVPEEYWRILSINLNLQYNYADITIGGYTSKKARKNENEPMNIKKIRAKWDEEEFLSYFTPEAMNARYLSNETDSKPLNIYAISYEYIKNKDEYFQDATDC